MELPGGRKLDRSLFDGLKSRFGLGNSARNDQYDQYDDDYRSYEESDADYEDGYGEYGYSDEYRSSSAAYDERSRSSSGPRLVSIDDVRATTPAPGSPRDRANRSAGSSSSGSRTGFVGGRMVLDSSLPPAMTPEGTAAYSAAGNAAANRYKGEGSRNEGRSGLDSLFGSSSDSGLTGSSRSISPSVSSSFSGATSKSSSFAPLANGRRALFILEPKAYGEAERIVDALDRNEVVVLNLKNTPDNLSKRILDFSFGVACALDAGVDFVDENVFTLSHGAPLSDAERMSLRSKGILQ